MTTTETVSKLDEALSKIDALLAAPVMVDKSFDRSAFEAYVAEQIEASVTETTAGKVEESKKRLTALKAVVEFAKASWDTGATAVTLTQHTDSWYLPPNTARAKVADVPSGLPKAGDSNIQTTADVLLVEKRMSTKKADGSSGGLELAPTDLFRALYTIAKASDVAPVRVGLAKSEEGRTLITKAGEALAILAKIALIFNVQLEKADDLLDCELRWQVGDMISALQSAARVEQVMAQMGAGLGVMMKEDGTPVATPAAKSLTPAAALLPAVGEVAWPLDMASAELDEKTGIFKDTRGIGARKHHGWDESEKLDGE